MPASRRSGRPFPPAGLCRDARGAAALEFALTAPVLIVVLGQMLQFGLILFAYNDMSHVAWTIARQVATGSMSTVAAVEEARQRLVSWGAPPSVEVSDPVPGLPEITVEISLPMSSLRMFDPMNLLGEGMVTVRAAAPQ